MVAKRAFAAQTRLKYKRVVILGAVNIKYIKNDCPWGGEDRAEVIRRCKQRAISHYMHLRKANE